MADQQPEKKDGKAPVENPQLEKGEDLGGDEVQQRMDVETAQGFSGMNVDPTPDSHYTVAGVTANKPTPETDPKAAQKAESVASGALGAGKFRDMEQKADPAKMITLRNAEGREITVSEKLRSNYPDYKESGK